MVMMPIDYEPPEPRCTVRPDGIVNVHNRTIQHALRPPCSNREARAACTHDTYQSGAPLTWSAKQIRCRYETGLTLSPLNMLSLPHGTHHYQAYARRHPTSDPYDGERSS